MQLLHDLPPVLAEAAGAQEAQVRACVRVCNYLPLSQVRVRVTCLPMRIRVVW